MKCPICTNELRKEDFPVIRLHPHDPMAIIVQCMVCGAEITAKHVVTLEPVGIYRRAEDQLKKVGG